MKYKFIAFILLMLFIFIPFGISMNKPYVKLKEPLSYFDGTRFTTTDEITQGNSSINRIKFLSRMLKKLVSTERPPFNNLPTVIPSVAPEKDIRIYFINHSTLLIQTDGLNILTDPIYSDIAGIWKFGVYRNHNPGIDFEDLPKIDIILLSHNHYDHMDKATLIKLKNKFNSLILTPLGNDTIIRNFGGGFKIQTLKYGETTIFKSLKITLERANHYSQRNAFDRNKALWGSFIIENSQKKKIFFAGDTAYHKGTIFKNIYKTYGKMDVALIPIGAYKPRSFLFKYHANPSEAVKIHQLLHSKISIGIHFGTFQLGQDTPLEALNDLTKAKKLLGIAEQAFITLEPGSSLDFK